MHDVPAVVRNKAIAVGASAWLDELPSLIDDLCERWVISVGSTYQDATEAFAAEAMLRDGTQAVLKVVMPRDFDAAGHEIAALRFADGDGCARLLQADVEAGALLIERLGTPLSELGWPLVARHEVLCDAASRIWRRVPPETFPTGADKGRWLIEFIVKSWEELDRPCSEKAVAQAVRCATARIAAHDDEQAVLVHGDVHQWNALQADVGFKLVDPDGLFAQPEYDLGILMREDPVELFGTDGTARATWLAKRTNLNARAIWEWGVAERVSTGLLATSVELQPVGAEMLHAAEEIATLAPNGWPA